MPAYVGCHYFLHLILLHLIARGQSEFHQKRTQSSVLLVAAANQANILPGRSKKHFFSSATFKSKVFHRREKKSSRRKKNYLYHICMMTETKPSETKILYHECIALGVPSFEKKKIFSSLLLVIFFSHARRSILCIYKRHLA